MNIKALRIAAAALALVLAGSLAVRADDASPGAPGDFDAFSRKYGHLFQKIELAAFRHPMEQAVVSEMMQDQKVLDLLPEVEKILEEINQSYHTQHLLSGVLVSEKQFPEIHKMACEVAQQLALPRKFRIYVMNSAQMNAYTWSANTDDYGVALFSGIIRALTPGELRFVLAHEMGHVKAGHIRTAVLLKKYYEKYKDVPDAMSKSRTILPPDAKKAENEDEEEGLARRKLRPEKLLGLSDFPAAFASDLMSRVTKRAAPMEVSAAVERNVTLLDQAKEYTSDRAGLVASGQREESLKGLVKLASGNVGNLGGFDLDSYLEQIDRVISGLDREKLRSLLGQEGDHAFTLMRVGELDLYHDSEDFRRASSQRDSDPYGQMLSAYFQISRSLAEKQLALAKFREEKTSREMNALERRLRLKELEGQVTERAAAEEELRTMLLVPILNAGLGRPNARFDALEAFVRAEGDGQPMLALLEDVEQKIRGRLTRPDLPEEERPELERKLAVVAELKALKPAPDEEEETPSEE